MRAHPLGVSAPACNNMKFLQPRFPQIAPRGGWAESHLLCPEQYEEDERGHDFLKEYLRICERVHLISSTINLDKGDEEMNDLVRKKYTDEGVDIGDPEENPFHEDFTSLKPSWPAW